MAIDIEAPGASEADLQLALSNLMKFRGCRVRMTADDTTQDITAEPSITFDEAQIDTDGFWSAGSPTRVTIPTGKGITHVELVGQVFISSSTADAYGSTTIFHLNSSNVVQRAIGQRFVECGNAVHSLTVATGVIPVSDGDYFQLRPRQETDTSVTIEGNDTVETFMSLKVVGMNPV